MLFAFVDENYFSQLTNSLYVISVFFFFFFRPLLSASNPEDTLGRTREEDLCNASYKINALVPFTDAVSFNTKTVTFGQQTRDAFGVKASYSRGVTRSA